MASWSRSVAKICSVKFSVGLICSSASVKAIPSEYASSPVEQPTDHARSRPPAGRSAKSTGMASVCSCAQASGSRKKLVTPINSSLKSNSTSWGFSCRKRT
ncbi:MAG: hypothetical protein ACD_74C00210G0002 [uncultured bacterium]|nr:MAG: hypothetical protein ACD_74C00210G0002 [uncultured bacterium]